jgi:ribosomal protein S24E
MKLSLANEKENVFLKRKEFMFKIEHDKSATPSKASIQQLISKQFNHSVDSIDIVSIFSKNGSAQSNAKVFVWNEKKVPDLSVQTETKESSEEKKPAKEVEEKKQIKKDEEKQ